MSVASGSTNRPKCQVGGPQVGLRRPLWTRGDGAWEGGSEESQ